MRFSFGRSHPVQKITSKITSADLPRRRGKAPFLAAASLSALIGLTSSVMLESAIAPLPAVAYTGRLNVTLTVEPGETFEQLLRRAENVARAAAQRNFDRDILITDVLINISAEYQSRVSPILTLEATRRQWKNRPDTRRWATYYRSAKSLLNLPEQSPVITSPSPTANPAPPPAPATPTTPPTEPTIPAPEATPGSPEPSPATTTPASPDTTPNTPLDQPTQKPILPDRIPTPGGIGK